jgi:transposase
MTPRYRLKYFERDALDLWLRDKPELRELYAAKEAIYSFYRTKGMARASHSLTRLTDALAHSKLKELKRFRRTLKAWRTEILNYFEETTMSFDKCLRTDGLSLCLDVKRYKTTENLEG